MEAARAFCKKNFGDLVVITGESERKFLWKQARNSKRVLEKHQKCLVLKFKMTTKM